MTLRRLALTRLAANTRLAALALAALAFAALVLGALAPAAPARAAEEPRREDHGDLVVLHVYGSYREMGRQAGELLGPVLRDVYELQRAEYRATRDAAGPGMRLADRFWLPLWNALGRLGEDSGLHAELAGLADALGVAPRELLRASFALDAASTVFAATRAATVDGGALLGRNVDWGDAGGRRRPLLVHWHPTNGDLAHISVGWPLMVLPTVGLNEAGFAISLNYFDTEPLLGGPLPSWPQRRALQTARSVEEGIRVFESAGTIGAANYVVMADASGAVAMLECRTRGCARFEPAGDWFAQANHARTAAMIPHDAYRSPDSFARLAGMEEAVRRALRGAALTPELAARILRDRTGHAFPNAISVGNLYVLNAAVVQPGAGLLWHSTTMQPHAPFGAYHAFSPARDASGVATLPAAPELARGDLDAEAAAIAEARGAIRAQREGRAEEARARWEKIASAQPPRLDPARIALPRAWNLAALGELAAAHEALAPAVDPGAPFDARAHGLLARALLADALGRRDEALQLYAAALAHMDSRPEFRVFAKLRERARAGLAAPQSGPLPPLEWWLVGVPR